MKYPLKTHHFQNLFVTFLGYSPNSTNCAGKVQIASARFSSYKVRNKRETVKPPLSSNSLPERKIT